MFCRINSHLQNRKKIVLIYLESEAKSVIRLKVFATNSKKHFCWVFRTFFYCHISKFALSYIHSSRKLSMLKLGWVRSQLTQFFLIAFALNPLAVQSSSKTCRTNRKSNLQGLNLNGLSAIYTRKASIAKHSCFARASRQKPGTYLLFVRSLLQQLTLISER